MTSLLALPIDPFLEEIVRHARERRAVVVTAAPGAGKTTRVPPALAADGPVLLLQPRRIAARAIARRIADEQGWSLGHEVGWHVRLDRRFAPDTRLVVATEGILTARLQQDPLLSDLLTVVIDEFHERSIHADLGLALARQAWLARSDLRLVVMSATLDANRVSEFLGGCPIVDVPGRLHPVDVSYRPGVDVEQAIREHVPQAAGALLCFLPGAPEIRRTSERLSSVLDSAIRVLPLHGGLDADEQDRAIAPASEPRVILATNLAETTLTVPDVRVVIDSGLHKVARYDADRGVDSLDTERVSQDAADQRAGRAGRTAPGIAVRLWDRRDRLRPHREPDIARVDLASTVMEILAWGGDPRALDWFDAPPANALDDAFTLLGALGAVDASLRLTPLGRDLRRLSLHPRLARMLLAARGAPAAARACALISERHFLSARGQKTTCDLLTAVDDERSLPWHVIQVARDLGATAGAVLGGHARPAIDEAEFRRAVLTGYPDRVARRRPGSNDRLVLFSGTGARMARESGVYDAEFLVAVDVTTGSALAGGAAKEALIRIATSIDRDWIAPTSRTIEHRLDAASGVVRAVRVDRYGAIPLGEQPADVAPAIAARLIADAYLSRGPSEADAEIIRRLAFAGAPVSFEALVQAASATALRVGDVHLSAHVPPSARRLLEREAPADVPLPSGRRARLEYRPDGRVVAAVKLQELFGLGDTPRLGAKRVPVTFELLAPNGRPVQVTSDLRSFWTSGYVEVRKELRARYPRHPWPEDPWTAVATHRTIRKK